MIDTVPENGFFAMAIATETQRPLAWALMIQFVANRFDTVTIFVPELPGSDKTIIALSPTGPISEQWYSQIRSVCSFNDTGVCDPTPDPDRLKMLDGWFDNIQVNEIGRQQLAGQQVIYGVYK